MYKGYEQYDKQHLRNINQYVRKVDNIYKTLIQEAANIGSNISNINLDKPFSFDDYPQTKKRIDELLKKLQTSLQTIIVNGIDSEWTLSNNKNSELARWVFGNNIGKLTQSQYRKYFSTNDKARKAFINRKTAGLSISDRVWDYTKQFKTEIELGLDIGIRNGLPASEIARDLQQYLKNPDMLFRQVRDEHGILHLSQKAKEYHPGQGIYRSSHKNALRLARTETNIAYHEADYERWNQFDFVVGFEVKTSNRHEEWLRTVWNKSNKGKVEICDQLKGKYPKSFKFKGWHPRCICLVIPILKTPEELQKENKQILNGEKTDTKSVNEISDVPENFKKWVDENKDRIEKANNRGTLPYFIKDNSKFSSIEVDRINFTESKEIRVTSMLKYNSYNKDNWEKAYFDKFSGGFNVYHKNHNFSKTGGGGNAEKTVGKMLAKYNGKQVEFLPEGGKKSPDIRFDKQTWDVKMINNANEETIRKCIKDGRKADNAIFYWENKDKIELLRNAIGREIGKMKKDDRLSEMPNVYYMENGILKLLWKKNKG